MADACRDFITIVSGLPRTGTSMMMRMLEAGGVEAVMDNIRQADIDNPNGYYEFEQVKQVKDDASWLSATVGKVFKMVSMLLFDLPRGYRYKIVFMERDMDEMIASQNKMLARLGKPAGNDDGAVKNMYAGHLAKVKSWFAGRADIEVLFVSYNAAVKDPGAVAESVGAFIGGLDIAAMERVLDPALYRNRS
jgi:hypothetical protein